MLVGINFSVGPAALIGMLTPEVLNTSFWLAVIMIYYLLATFLPIDKIIGKILSGLWNLPDHHGRRHRGDSPPEPGIFSQMPELWNSLAVVHPTGLPKWAMMFVTVACGAISGFHATQSPMMARCMTSERKATKVFTARWLLKASSL